MPGGPPGPALATRAPAAIADPHQRPPRRPEARVESWDRSRPRRPDIGQGRSCGPSDGDTAAASVPARLPSSDRRTEAALVPRRHSAGHSRQAQSRQAQSRHAGPRRGLALAQWLQPSAPADARDKCGARRTPAKYRAGRRRGAARSQTGAGAASAAAMAANDSDAADVNGEPPPDRADLSHGKRQQQRPESEIPLSLNW